MQAFGIPSVVIYDKDVKQGQTPGDCEFFTNELCFEIEIVKNVYKHNRTDIVRDIVRELDPDGENVLLDLDFVKHNCLVQNCNHTFLTYPQSNQYGSKCRIRLCTRIP